MKVILNVLAVVALIATCSANFVEFSEDAVKDFGDFDAEASPIDAEVINADHEFQFYIATDDVYEEDVFLYHDELLSSAAGDGHNVCGNELGIQIADVGTFCDISFVHVGIDTLEEPSSYEYYGESDEDYVPEEEVEESSEEEDNKATEDESKNAEENGEEEIENSADNEVSDKTEALDEKAMHFTIYFDSNKTEPCVLEIPIFKVPSELDSSDPEKLKAWATKQRVGLLSPTDIEKLIAVREKGEFPLNFKWLNDHLKYGVFKTEDNSEDDSEDLSMYTNEDEDNDENEDDEDDDENEDDEDENEDDEDDDEDEDTDTGIAWFTSRPIVLSENDLEKVKAWISAQYSQSLKEKAA